jgi:hypothetical protein
MLGTRASHQPLTEQDAFCRSVRRARRVRSRPVRTRSATRPDADAAPATGGSGAWPEIQSNIVSAILKLCVRSGSRCQREHSTTNRHDARIHDAVGGRRRQLLYSPRETAGCMCCWGDHLRPPTETELVVDRLPLDGLPASRRLGRIAAICFWNSANEIALSPSVSCLKNSFVRSSS